MAIVKTLKYLCVKALGVWYVCVCVCVYLLFVCVLRSRKQSFCNRDSSPFPHQRTGAVGSCVHQYSIRHSVTKGDCEITPDHGELKIHSTYVNL